MARFSYFAPYDWVIGASVPEEEFLRGSGAIAASFDGMNISIGIGSLLLAAFAILLAWYFARRTIGPIDQVGAMVDEMEKGHLDGRLGFTGKDEFGQMARTMDRFADNLRHEIVDAIDRLAKGDLTFDIRPRDERDLVRGALKKLETDFNEIMVQIQTAGEQIASGSTQVAESSQSLSAGATEQASSLEQISSSIKDMAYQTKLSAENAGAANRLAEEARAAAVKGNSQMVEMIEAMGEINEASGEISKIIKVIDEIAFQTNLLALNAAVEAARAGQHGKGFAVVAEEVRNLAGRSAKAPSQTAELIEGSVQKMRKGAEIADGTAEALGGIVAGVTKVTDLVAEIASASSEQAQGIAQANQGLGQVEQVTQQNTASAAESAAAAEELAAQANELRRMLTRFTLKGAAAPNSNEPVGLEEP